MSVEICQLFVWLSRCSFSDYTLSYIEVINRLKGVNLVIAVFSLNGQILVTRHDIKEINVYDTSTLTLQRNITATVSSGLYGLAACTKLTAVFTSLIGVLILSTRCFLPRPT
jgi:hypothetical protein